jgi:tetratricopeptide (TPR) repeat protein
MTWEHEINAGRVALLCHDYIVAEEHFRQALVSLGEKTDIWDSFFPKTVALLGETLFLRKNYAEAKFYFEQLERILKLSSGDVYSRAVMNYCLAEIHLWLGDDQTALRFFRSAAPDLDSIFHMDHRYCRRTTEFIGDDREMIEVLGQKSDALQEVLQWAIDGQITEQLAKQLTCVDTMNDWIRYAQENLRLETHAGRLEAYAAMNHALALSTWCMPHVSSDSADVLSMMAEIAVVVRADDFAARLAHANLEITLACYGELSVPVAKAKEILAALYAQQGQLQVAEELFTSALECLRLIQIKAEMVMPEGLEIFEKLKTYRHCLRTADDLFRQGEEHFKQGKFRSARKCLEKAKQEMLKRFPVDNEILLPVHQCLVEVYQRLDMHQMVHHAKRRIAHIEKTRTDRLHSKDSMVRRLPALACWIDDPLA